MGCANNSLIPAAILLLNPGINRDEFAKLLKETKSSDFKQYLPKEPWNFFDKNWGLSYQGGLEGLASILGLNLTREFQNFNNKKTDENGLKIDSPYLWNYSNEKTKYNFAVQIHEQNKLLPSKKIEIYGYEKKSIGETIMNVWGEVGMIKEILKEEFIGEIDKKNSDKISSYEYKLKISPIEKIFRKETFSSKEEVYKKWPIFDPKNKFDWLKEKGRFKSGILSLYKRLNCFLWKQQDGKYYFDKNSFEKMKSNNFGYTDLILTQEAIKNHAWKILSYKGYIYTEQFLKDFPSAKAAYDKAVWDSHTSLHAKKEKMSVSDFLRMRITRFNSQR